MQIVYISNRPETFRATFAYVAAFMPFARPALVFCPAAQVEAFRAVDPALAVCDEAALLGGMPPDADHQKRNYVMRSRLAFDPRIEAAFIMSDDDYRPLRPLAADYFISGGKHQPYFFHTLERWAAMTAGMRRTSFDIGNVNTLELLKSAGLGTLMFASHMPQVVDKAIFAESVRRFEAPARAYSSITEWDTYFNHGLAEHPRRFHPPRPFTTLGWPDRPHWKWFVPPASFDFENFDPRAYTGDDLFAGLPQDYDPATHATATAAKIARYTQFFADHWAFRERRDARRKLLYAFRPRALRRLPEAGRRLVRKVAALAPRGPVPPLAAPIHVAGLFRFPTGLGNAALRLCRTLESTLGTPPAKVDVSPLYDTAFDATPLRTGEVTGPGTLVVALNPVEGAAWLKRAPRALVRGKRLVGYWWWEFPTFPETWLPAIASFDEVWVSSRFLYDSWHGRIGKPLRYVPLDLRDPAAGPPAVILPAPRVLTILNLGSTLARKNPAGALAVLDRVRALGQPSASLTIKLGGIRQHPQRYLAFLDLAPSRDGVDVIVGDLSDAAMTQLIDDHPLYLSMHRAEGLGLPLAEAMGRGRIAVATGWSGNLDYMTAGTSLLVASRPGTIRDENRNTSADLPCAMPDPEDAARQICALLEDPAGMQAMAVRARQRIAAVSEAALAVNRETFAGLA